MSLLGHVSKIVSIPLSKLSACPNTDILLSVTPIMIRLAWDRCIDQECKSACKSSCMLTLSHPMMPYGVMVSHKLMGIYMGVLIWALYYRTWFLLVVSLHDYVISIQSHSPFFTVDMTVVSSNLYYYCYHDSHIVVIKGRLNINTNK